MNTFDWDFDDHPTRGTDVRRRLMLDHRSYDVTAFDDGSGFVGLRLVGWDSGYVFTELVVELPVGDATDVGQLLASALAGFRGGGSPPPGSPLGSPPLGPPSSGEWLPYDRSARDPRPAAPKSGQPWEPADLELLVRRFREGATIKTLTVELGRTDGAIRQRLQILGEVRPAPAAVLSTDGVPEGVPAGEPEGAPAEAPRGSPEEVSAVVRGGPSEGPPVRVPGGSPVRAALEEVPERTD
ncbi:hypothetical protein ACFO1B_26505 [Dactylosporangium siamense]|uniref:Uncharacterized protein n=1 Tax=Dactylosporangium siamense TaxID=685454 RepID=A0A919UCG3_9ACTN|nr:hypothetical protein [Dactylosporangium siamense]GIG46570.1 hypothetical protein Dsi01nite_046110 [Dactylosporangium siamense]